MGRMRKKYEKGAATTYISRNQAIRKLQLSLADFRRLCIIKGIYPQEPLHKKKVNKGSTAPKTYYHVKDVNFLLHEPLINKFREFKHYSRRLKRAVNKRNKNAADRIRQNRPEYAHLINTIVRERYPSFVDALRELDDCLNLCFSFANFPTTKRARLETIRECRRLTVEFMHYVIASNSLRKVFVSIKGYYYEADIMGEKVQWVVAHKRGHEHPEDVDYKIMGTFAEFYVRMLSFVNYRLFSSINLHYPPKLTAAVDEDGDEERLTSEETEERIDSLAPSLMLASGASVMEEVEEPDVFVDPEDPDKVDASHVERQRLMRLQRLFRDCCFYLGREVDRDPLVFTIRSFGGQVSWDSTVGSGATYQESDERITHQVMDRGNKLPANQHFNRRYVQPQWVFDSVNSGVLLPTEPYLLGAMLPPHVSPFLTEQPGEYLPPEKLALIKLQQGEKPEETREEESESDSSEDEEEVAEDSEEEEPQDSKKEAEDSEEKEESDGEAKGGKKAQKRKKADPADKQSKKAKVSDDAASGKGVREVDVVEVPVSRQLRRQEAEERKLSEMMIHKKHRRLYSKIRYKEKKTSQEARVLKEKREALEKAKKKEKKGKKTKVLKA